MLTFEYSDTEQHFQMKATEQHFPVVLLVVLTFDSVDGILQNAIIK